MQSFPLDLFTPDFYKNRKTLINKRLEELRELSRTCLRREISKIFEKKSSIITPFINWNSHITKEENLISIALGLGAKILTDILEEMSKHLKFMMRGSEIFY